MWTRERCYLCLLTGLLPNYVARIGGLKNLRNQITGLAARTTAAPGLAWFFTIWSTSCAADASSPSIHTLDTPLSRAA